MPEPTKATRVHETYALLKNEICSNGLPTGFEAPEPEIAKRLGMSRTPVREAPIRLEAEGPVELRPRRGARVLPNRADDMREILTALEPKAAAFAARRPRAQELAPPEVAISDMESALAAEDLVARAEADNRFRLTLPEKQGNRRLKAFVSAIYD
ncbi:MAG: GntR family transcriptional regulator [Rhodobacter sp.]|nr:GntR family transcriptional regulator [Rhodobacter sp.]